MPKVGEIVTAPPQKLKAWRMDALRNEDRVQMQNMAKKLRKFRGDAPMVARRVNNPPSASSSTNGSSIANTNSVTRAPPKKQSMI